MANAEKGQAALVVEGKPYTLDFTFNAYCEAETLLGLTFREIMAAVQPGALQLGVFRVLFWSMLQPHQPELDLEAAGNLIAKAGLAAALTAASGAIEAAEWLPKGAGTGAGQNPRRPPAGRSGKRS